MGRHEAVALKNRTKANRQKDRELKTEGERNLDKKVEQLMERV